MGSPDEIRRRCIELSGPLAGAGELRGRHSEHHSGTRPDGAVAGSGRWVSSLGWGLGRVSACGSSFGAGGLRASRSLRSGSDLWSALAGALRPPVGRRLSALSVTDPPIGRRRTQMNRYTATGHLTRDPELVLTGGGTEI